jgi:serine/threonine-protein kinase
MVRTSIVLPPEAPLAPPNSFCMSVGSPSLALAPDGSKLVYVALVDDTRQLYRRDMRTGKFQPMAGTEDAQGPFFAPDSQWVGFLAEGKMKKVRIEGGEPEELADVVWGHGGEWGTDGFVYFCPTEMQAVHRVPVAGGSVEAVTRRAPGEMMHLWPTLVPGNKHLLVTRIRGRTASIGQARIGGEEPPATLFERGAWGRLTATGHLVIASEGRLLASPYHHATMQLIDAPTVLLEDVRTENSFTSNPRTADSESVGHYPALGTI